MIACSVMNVLRPKKVLRKCRKFWCHERCIVKYYSYHTEVFYKCLNGCAQCNECAEAKKGAETMPEILAL